MKNQFNLEINKSCTENFNQFKPTLDGGFCRNCKKNVIDFSKKTTEEIINYFKNNNNLDTCGRFNSNQLKTYTEPIFQRKKFNIWSNIGLACLSLFSFNTTQAQTESTKQQTSGKEITKQEKEIFVKGNVSDYSGSLPGVNVVLQGTRIGTETNFDGEFTFPKALKKGDVLVFSFIGFESQKVTINNEKSTSNIELKINFADCDIVLMGKVASKKVYKSKRI